MKNTTLFCLIIFSFTLAQAQSPIYVDINATGTNNGQTWANAYSDLQSAILVAGSGDEIWVAAGTYFPTTSNDRNISFEPGNGTRLYGGFAGIETNLSQRDWEAHPTILSGDIGAVGDSSDNSLTVLYLYQSDSSTVLDGFCIRDGLANDIANANDPRARQVCGAGLYIEAANWEAFPNIMNCQFLHNSAQNFGGAVMVNGSQDASVMPLFKNCIFEANYALISGGGLARFGGSWVERGIDYEGCIFRKNRAEQRGAGLYINDTQGPNSVSIVGCAFEQNSAINSGGGAFIWTGKSGQSGLAVINSNFEANNSGEGAAMTVFTNGSIFDGIAIIDSCVFSKNNSTTSGTGTKSIIYADQFGTFQTEVVIKNSQISENVSSAPILGMTWENATFLINKNKVINNTAGSTIYLGSYLEARINCTAFILNDCVFLGVFAALDLQDNKFDISNCLFVHNKIEREVRVQGGTFLTDFSIINSTFFNERRPGTPYDVLFASPNEYKLLFQNNIVSDSIGQWFFYSDDSEVILNNDNFGFIDCSVQPPNVTCGPNNLIGLAPMFRDTAGGDFSLRPCSPLINAGSNAAAAGLQTDITGGARIQDGIVDIGAYEAPAFALAGSPSIIPACSGTQGGAITISPDFGCEPYTYQWNPAVGNGPELNGLPVGDYAFTVTDAQGRTISDTLSIGTAPSPLLTPVATILQCGTLLGGTATVHVSSGTAPFAFLWNNAATDSLLTMLPAGTYQVTVTDSNGCQDSTEMNITQQGQITLMVSGIPISCFGETDAILSVTPANGKAPFSYLWSNGAMEAQLSDLGPGMYTVTSTDAYGCTSTFTFNVTEPLLLQANATSMPCHDLQNPDGSATLAFVTGGTQSFSYAWSTGETGLSITNLLPGTYTVTVTDAHGCTATATAVVTLMVGTEELGDIAVRVWPNPMRDYLEIQALDLPAGDYHFELLDGLGRIVAASGLSGGQAVLATGILPAGAYEWRLRSDFGVLRVGKVLR